MRRNVLLVTCLVTLALLAACGSGPGGPVLQLATPTANTQLPDGAQSAAKPAAAAVLPTARATAVPLKPTATPRPSATVAAGSDLLTILHTNDNWGETEPCG